MNGRLTPAFWQEARRPSRFPATETIRRHLTDSAPSHELMVCDNEESMHSATITSVDSGGRGRLDAAGDDAGHAAAASDSAGGAVNSAEDHPSRERRRTHHHQQQQSQERHSWKMMRRDSDELNSYLAGDLAVGVRSREVDDDDDSRSIASSSTTSGGMLQQQQESSEFSGDDNNGDFAPSSLPVTSIRQPTSGLSLTTHSSLSTSATADHNGGSSRSVTRRMSQASEGSEEPAGTNANAEGASASSVTPNNSAVSPRSPHAAHTPIAGNNDNNVENTPPPTRAPAEGIGSTSEQQGPTASSMVRSGSGAAGSLTTAQSAVTADSWGFFDDHDPTIDTPGDARRKTSGGQAATTPGGSSNNNSNNHRVRGSSLTSTPSGGGSGSGSKRRGMLNFSDVMSQPLQAIPLLDPPKAELNPDAVTAPTYVLEESMSSQNLWKHTAGNRPPQPAEERAFYEKIWAENFSKSQVHYEMPPEVLVSTTPISLSAFADGRDDGAGVSADYAVLGHESAAGAGGGGGGGPMAGKTIGGIGGSSSIGPSRMLGAAGAAQHYHLAKTGDSSLGPHHPHHTMVNRTIHEKDGDLLIVCKGDNVFGTTVSKSFETVVGRGSKRRTESVSVSVSVASYRVVECQKEKGKQYAQFLVIYCEGSFRDVSVLD